MLARDGLLRVLLRDVVGFGGDHGDELDAALDQQVAGLLGEGHGLRVFVGGFGREDFVDDLLDRCWVGLLDWGLVGGLDGSWVGGQVFVAVVKVACVPLGRERSSLPMSFYISIDLSRSQALRGRQVVAAHYSPPISLSDMLGRLTV